MERVYCSNCFYYVMRYDGKERCDAPSNKKDTYYMKDDARKAVPSYTNRDNSCTYYKEHTGF